MVQPMPQRDAGAGSPQATAVAGLAKIALVLRSHGWRRRGETDLTPTQAQIVVALRSRPGRAVGELARELGVSSATISDSLSALVAKGLALRARSSRHPRAVAVHLTKAGARVAERADVLPDALLSAVETLDVAEQAVLVRALTKMIRELQVRGEIPVARMCPGCTFFRPNVYSDVQRPHHCAYVDRPFGDRELRLDCPDEAPLASGEAALVWAIFNRPVPQPEQEER